MDLLSKFKSKLSSAKEVEGEGEEERREIGRKAGDTKW